MLGAIAADVIGSEYEARPIKTTDSSCSRQIRVSWTPPCLR
jgi:hypothetical protein